MKHPPHAAARERKGAKAMSKTIRGVYRAPNATDDASKSHRKSAATDPTATESTHIPSGNKAVPEAAAKDNANMPRDIEIGTVSDADEYSIDQSHVDGGTDDDLQKVFAGRPSEDYYWRTHPDKDNEWKLAWTITFEDATYLVHPSVAEVKRASERKLRPLLLVRCVNVKGREQIWPLKLDRPGKKSNECNASAQMVAELMCHEWLMLVYDDETKTYFGRRPVPAITDEPKWTQRTFQQLRELAFPEDRRINTLEHAVWRKLASGR
jgi:hypothetical protein